MQQVSNSSKVHLVHDAVKFDVCDEHIMQKTEAGRERIRQHISIFHTSSEPTDMFCICPESSCHLFSTTVCRQMQVQADKAGGEEL